MKVFNTEAVAVLRQKAGISQQEFANRINQVSGGAFTKQHVSLWESGAEPKASTLVHMAAAFQLQESLAYFFKEKPARPGACG